MNKLPDVTHVATDEALEQLIREWRRELGQVSARVDIDTISANIDPARITRIPLGCVPYGIYGSAAPTPESDQYRGTAGSRRPYQGPDGRQYEVVLTGGIATKNGEPLLDCFREVRLPDREQIPCHNCKAFSDRGLYSMQTHNFICDDCK